MSTRLLNASGVCKTVPTAAGRLEILRGADLSLHNGEAVAILGASGSGKSTLLGLLAGLDLPDSGSIQFNETELTNTDEDTRARLRARHTSFVFQAFHLLEDLTAEENIALPLELFGNKQPLETAREWLHRLNMGDRNKHYPNQLSGGEQQRVALCRAFAQQPALLFADEPTANLDSDTARIVVDALFKLRSETNTSMLLVTHDQELADRCDRVLRLQKGKLHETLN